MNNKPDLREVVKVLSAMCTAVGTPRALAIDMLAANGEWDQLVSLTCDPKHYSNAESYYGDRQVTDFLRKMKNLPLTVDLHKAAVDTFIKCEKMCYKSNERLSPFIQPGSLYLDDNGARIKSGIISRIRAEIREILGPLPARLYGRLGPGATFSDKGRSVTVPHKFSSVPSLTRSVAPYLRYWDDKWNSIHNDRGGSLNLVRGNRFTSVPKDSTKNRGICIEPALNLWFQLSVGSIIRRKLKQKRDICLDSGQEVHRRLACLASRDGTLATLDLSNASDTISRNLVRLLLPSDWFSLLDDLRSPFTYVEGAWHRLEKFSSMGNGFTFELETLIFYSICRAITGSEDVWCYGDDMIIPTEFFGDVVAALEFFGFEVNRTKSFGSGPFRESCGGDFFFGTVVRPYYLKEAPNGPEDWIAVANGLYRAGCCSELGSPRFRVIRKARDLALRAIPSSIRRCRGPECLGDVVIHDHESNWHYNIRHGIRWFSAWLPVSSRRVPWRLFTGSVQLAAILYGVGADHRGVVPRDSVSGFRIGRVAYS